MTPTRKPTDTAARPRRHPSPTGEIQARLELGLLDGLLGILGRMPVERARKLAGAVASAAPVLTPRLARVGMQNLAAAFPEQPRAWCAETLRASFRQLGFMAGEVAHFAALTPQNIGDVVGFESAEDEARFRERAEQRRAIIATGHFGNWELFAQASGLLGAPIHVVHRPFKNPLVDDRLTALRGRAGTRVVYKHAAARDILRVLRRGELVAVPIDQHAPGATGIPIPFFGRPAKTTPGPARLAQLAQVPIVVAALARIGDTGRHRIVAGPEIPPPPRTKDPAALIEVTTELNRQFEKIVRRYPEQWLWMHRRWRVPTPEARGGAA